MKTWEIDQTGRLFFEGRWVATIEAEARHADPYRVDEILVAGVKVRVSIDQRSEAREDEAMASRLELATRHRLSFTSTKVDLEAWEAVNAEVGS